MSCFFKFIQFSLAFSIHLTLAKNWNFEKLENWEYNLDKCIAHLLANERINYTRNIRISVCTDPGRERFISGDIIDRLRAGVVDNSTTFDLVPYPIKKSSYDIQTRLFIVDSFESFRDLLQLQRKFTQDVHGLHQYYYIVLTNNQQHTNTIEKILELCLKNYIVNVNVIVEDSNGINTIYTYFPFTKTSCRKSVTTVYNRFVGGKLQWNRPVFPRKIKNLWLCPIRAITWHKPPFVFLGDEKVSGIDGNFLIFLSKAMNFTLDVFESPQGLGVVFPNGTMKGAFNIIKDNEGDLMVGGTVCTSVRRKYLACTRDYFTSAIQIIVRRPSNYSSLEVLLFPFDSKTWCTFLTFFIINIIARSLCRKMSKVFHIRGVLSTRMQIITWLLSVFIIRSSYEGSIFQFLHNQPLRRIPQTFEEAVKDGFKFIAKSSYLPFIQHIPELTGKLILIESSLGALIEEFDKFEGKYALINVDNYLTVIANDTSRYGQYAEIRVPILHNIICAYLPRFSFLTEELNDQIRKMVSHGHMKKLYDISVTDKLKKLNAPKESVVHTIPLIEIVGAFEFLGFLNIVGVLLLFMEMLATKNVLIKKIMDFFN